MHYARLAKMAVFAASLVATTQVIAAPVIVGTYYDETATNLCNNNSICIVSFTQLPSNMMLKVQKVKCNVSGQPYAINLARLEILTAPGGTALSRFLPLPLTVLSDAPINNRFWGNIDADAQWLIGQGRFPIVELQAQAGNSMSAECTLIGELVNPP